MEGTPQSVSIRPLGESDLPEANAILRRAFATQFGMPPETFWTDRDYLTARWMMDRSLAFGAWAEGHLVGSCLGVNWGSLGIFGPISTHPNTWNRGIARLLIPPVVERLRALGARHIGFFTIAESTKHIALYQKFGFWPRFLTAIMARPVDANGAVPQSMRFSAAAAADRTHWLDACRVLTNELRDGLDVTAEVPAACDKGYGDTIFITEGSKVEAVALCEYGPRSPAGAGSCLMRFAAVRPGPDAEERFDHLLTAWHRLAADQGLERVMACVSASRLKAYRHLLSRGFRAERHGVTMHEPNDDAYAPVAKYVLTDWR